jgi:hypothetical protein
MNPGAPARGNIGQKIQKHFLIVVILKDQTIRQAAVHHMVVGPGILNAQWT